MKRFGRQAALFSTLVFILNGCASNDEVTQQTTSQSQSSGTVPGEKVSSDGGLTPGAGPGGANASVKW
jgi:hypothetical protein